MPDTGTLVRSRDRDRELPTNYQTYIHLSKYSRWRDDLGRRETWPETVDRYFSFWEDRFPGVLDDHHSWLRRSLLTLATVPSMRCLMTAGVALEKDNISAFNCSFLTVDKIEAWDEMMYILMCGTGVGFSVERRYVERLPRVPRTLEESREVIVVGDSKIGWATALRELIASLYQGVVKRWDVSQVRPSGAVLRTFGGRASGPEPLVRLFEHVVRLFVEARGRQLSTLEAHSICCLIGDIVVVGGVRRAAMISLFSPDDAEMLHAKTGDWFEKRPYLAMANNSAVYESRPSIGRFFEMFGTLADSGSGEPGIFNRDGAQRQASRWGTRSADVEYGINPCFTGDTLVAVADGRGAVRFDELASSGKDVSVYTRTRGGDLAVRTMRSPRTTGKDRRVYTVRFTDGTQVRATADHRFVMLDGSMTRTLDLQGGDRTAAMTRYAATFNEVFGRPDSRSQEYWWVTTGAAKTRGEHRMIAEHRLGRKLTRDEVVHHVDTQGQNNDPANLEVMDKTDHNALHAAHMRGDRNPARRCMTDEWRKNLSVACAGALNGNANPHTHDELFAAAVTLASTMGDVPTKEDWRSYAREHGLPENFNKWRRDHLGNLGNFLGRAAAVALGGLTVPDGTDPRTVRKLHRWLAQGYDASIVDGKVVGRKRCEQCGESMIVHRIEESYCSRGCARKAHPEKWAEERRKTSAGLRRSHAARRDLRRAQQVEVYLALGDSPAKADWVRACKEARVSAEISRESSPFKTWRELQETAAGTNHVVESVSFSGVEDVYDGTVDEHHTLFVGSDAFDPAATTRSGRERMTFVCVANCGEIILRDQGTCNLSEAIARPGDSEMRLLEKLEVAAIFGTLQSTLTDFRYLRPVWKRNCEEERLLGVSIAGIPDHSLLRGDHGQRRLADFLERAHDHVWRTNSEWAARVGVNESTAISCLKPSGNTSQLAMAASPLKPWHAARYVRRTRGTKTDPVSRLLMEAGVPHEDELWHPDTTVVFEWPHAAPEGAVTRRDWTALQQLELWRTYKQHWCDHNPSVTVNVKADEWAGVAAWAHEHWDDLIGVAFLPDEDHTYQQAPYEEVTDARFEKLVSAHPRRIDWAQLSVLELEDRTESARELACTAGACVI